LLAYPNGSIELLYYEIEAPFRTHAQWALGVARELAGRSVGLRYQGFVFDIAPSATLSQLELSQTTITGNYSTEQTRIRRERAFQRLPEIVGVLDQLGAHKAALKASKSPDDLPRAVSFDPDDDAVVFSLHSLQGAVRVRIALPPSSAV